MAVSDVIVIGGGVAGLVAARHCARVGLSVTILEATDAVGGAVSAHEVAGLTLDRGAESFAVRRGTVADFVEGLGLADETVAPNPAGAWLYLPGDNPDQGPVSVPLPKAGVLGIPTSPLADDVRRAIGWRGAVRAYLDRLMPVLKIGREHSLGELVQKRMGRRVLERLVEPVASGVYSAPAAELDIDVVAPGLNNALTVAGSLSGAVTALRSAAPAGSAVAGLRGGMTRLVDALVADLDHYGVEIVTGTRAERLSASGGDDSVWTVWTAAESWAHADTGAGEWEGLKGETRSIRGRFVIVAVPAEQSLGLLGSVSPELAALAGLDWPEPTAVELATIVIDAPALDGNPRGTGVLVAPGTPGVTAKALTHVSAKWAWVAEAAGEGRHVIRLSYGRAGEAGVSAGLSDDEFAACALRDASALLGVELAAASVRGFARTAWRDALSPATIGARARVAAVREAIETVPGLDVTGAWLAGTGLASVIPDALDAGVRTRHAALGF